jgi:DNA helicase-2/ATP-dependent DNA helicase PcrA
VFSAQADVVERLVSLARLGELASAFARRAPHATARDFARYAAAVADAELRDEDDEGAPPPAGVVQVMALDGAGGRELDWVFVLGLTSARMPGARLRAGETIPDALLKETLGPDDRTAHVAAMRRLLYTAMTRARTGLVLAYPARAASGAVQPPSPFAEEARAAVGAEWEDLARGSASCAWTPTSTSRTRSRATSSWSSSRRCWSGPPANRSPTRSGW